MPAPRRETQASRLDEDDYLSFSAALGSSARGRAFLHEYARRNRHADTEVVLEALFRLEKVAHGQKSEPEAARIRQDLRALLDTIRSARPQIDQSPGAIKAATLSALIEFLQARIESLVTPTGATGAVGFLAPVPQAEQPELPMPQPGSSALRSIALVQPIAPPVGEALRPPPDPLVLSLDARVAPVFGQQPGFTQPEPPRPAEIIPEVDFIDTLFDRIEAQAARQAEADELAAALALTPPKVANTNVPPAAAPAVETVAETATPVVLETPAVAAPVAAVAPTPAPATPLSSPSRAVLPALDLQPLDVQTGDLPPVDLPNLEFQPLDLRPMEAQPAVFQPLELPVAAPAAAETITVGEIVALSENGADPKGRTVALTQATLATAAAIDDIIVAAQLAIAEAAHAGTTKPGVAETAGGKFVAASTVAPLAAALETFAQPLGGAQGTARIDTAAHAIANVVADPSQQVWDNALAAIMALSDEERLALFT
ncbi:MAG TPA: hypothetical protein VGC36_16440 [Rhizomicrobium sp.]